MQYILAAALVFALGAVTASAMPMTGPRVMSQSNVDAPVLIAKRSHQAARSHARRSHSDGGIHPLVGSGEY